jgi:hypothetical protein
MLTTARPTVPRLISCTWRDQAAFSLLVCGSCLALACHFFLVSRKTRAARRPPCAVTELSDIYLELINSAAQSIAVHSQLPCSAALIAFVFFEHGRNKAALKFAHCFGIKNIAAIHLQYECFELIFHWNLSFMTAEPSTVKREALLSTPECVSKTHQCRGEFCALRK